MPYYLKLYFDPSFDYRNLRPREMADGSVDHYNMGYVQNVKRGQVLAEWVDSAADAGDTDADHMVLEEREFPAGRHTAPDPENPDRLLAAASGYVFMLDGAITVKKTLNVRRDVDFHTGNITFYGNVVVHGSVRAGFQVQGLNVLVKDTVEGALLRATDSFMAEGGIKGGGKAIVKAGSNMRVPFAEKAMLLAEERMLIDGACMHCDVFAGRQLAIKGRLVGGQAVCTNTVYVGEQLGGGLGAGTTVVLGYDAILLNKSWLLETKIAETHKRLEETATVLAKHPGLKPDLEEKRRLLRERLDKFSAKRRQIWERIEAVENLDACQVRVPGKVRPGVEICIGGACLVVKDYLEDVCFTYRDREIVVTSPALKK